MSVESVGGKLNVKVGGIEIIPPDDAEAIGQLRGHLKFVHVDLQAAYHGMKDDVTRLQIRRCIVLASIIEELFEVAMLRKHSS